MCATWDAEVIVIYLFKAVSIAYCNTDIVKFLLLIIPL